MFQDWNPLNFDFHKCSGFSLDLETLQNHSTTGKPGNIWEFGNFNKSPGKTNIRCGKGSVLDFILPD